MEIFWQEMHERNDGPALTGSRLANIERYLGLSRRDFPAGSEVLEIGVGLGHCTRELAAAGVRVSVLDTCPAALARVRDVAYRLYRHRWANSLLSDTFDLVFCHLVTQHMSENDILWQHPNVFRSLKPGGRFVCQWAGSRIPGENNLTETILGQYGPVDGIGTVGTISGRMCRDENYVRDLVSRCGGEVTDVRGRFEWERFASYWFTTESRRAS